MMLGKSDYPFKQRNRALKLEVLLSGLYSRDAGMKQNNLAHICRGHP